MRKLIVVTLLSITLAATASAAAAKPKALQAPKIVHNKSRVKPTYARTMKTAKVKTGTSGKRLSAAARNTRHKL